jgi:uncharacterized membrane protein
MARIYYIEKQDETAETSSRLEAIRIAAEWKKRGYDVETVVVDTTESLVETQAEESTSASRRDPMNPRPRRSVMAASS